MELKFEKKTCSCLDTVLREIQNSEQTQEIKLPDGMPDIGRILSAWGQVILRGKEWRSDSISFSGGMMVWVLYAPEDGSTQRCIDSWIPFQMRWNLPEGLPEGTIRLMCLPRFVDARSVSARKIMVRSGLAAMAEANVPKSIEVFALSAPPEGVEILENTYPVRLIKETGEKTFLLDEQLVLPDSAPHPESIIYYSLNPKITDKRVMANKLVFRGSGNLHLLYRSEEGQLHSWDFELPFSQYAELDGNYGPDAAADILPVATSVELELNGEGQFHLKGGVVAQYQISDVERLAMIEDAYSPGRELSLEIETLELPVVLENRRENIYGEQTIHAESNMTADVRFLPDFPRQRRTENGVQMELPGTFQMLYYGEDGNLHSGTARWEGTQSLNADGDTDVTAIPMVPESQAISGTDTITARADIPMEVTSTARQRIPMVTGLELGEVRQPDPMRPSVILRRAGEDSLWDIAKSSGTTRTAIRNANKLTDEPAPGQMLLIPVS